MAHMVATVRDLSFNYGQSNGSSGDTLFEDFTLSIGAGATAIGGASGCGKSTLGRLLAGHMQPTRGAVCWNNGAAMRPRDIGYLDQSALDAVFPWQTVAGNIQYALSRLGWGRAAAKVRVDHLIELFQLGSVARAFPARLSGGELQRAAIARCVSWTPRVLILDESLSALDHATKSVVAEALRRLVDDEDVTLILITHSGADVELLADRYIVVGGCPVSVIEDRQIRARKEEATCADQLTRRRRVTA